MEAWLEVDPAPGLVRNAGAAIYDDAAARGDIDVRLVWWGGAGCDRKVIGLGLQRQTSRQGVNAKPECAVGQTRLRGFTPTRNSVLAQSGHHASRFRRLSLRAGLLHYTRDSG